MPCQEHTHTDTLPRAHHEVLVRARAEGRRSNGDAALQPLRTHHDQPPRPAPVPGHRTLKLLSPPRATSSSDDAAADQEQPAAATKTATVDDDFEERVMRIKSRVGPKKRGARKKKAAAGTASAGAVTLPPVPLREAKSRLGAPVEFGFTAYSERLNGALAGVGLAALLLVELGSGQALVKYHQPATLFLQVYTVAAAAALFVKYEKERISKWPGPSPAKPPSSRK